MGSVKKKVDKVMNKVADKIMPKEVAKVMPYVAMAAPFLGPVGMLATLPAQALADAKNYGKLNYKKLALQAAMTGLAKTGQAGKATAAEKNFMGKMGGDPTLNPDSFRAPTDAMQFAADNPDAFKTFAEGFKYEPGLEGIGQRVSDVVTKTGRSMYQPLQFGENAPSISDQLFNMDRAKQAAFMLGPMSTYAGMDALDQMEAGQGGGGTATSGGMSAQALYDDFLQSGRLAGYTDEEINTIYGPYGDMAGGDYQTVNVNRGPRRRQFPGTNYNLFTYANGGRIGFEEGGGLFERTSQIPEMFTTDELPSDPLSQIVKIGMAVRAPLLDVVEKLGLGAKESARIVSDLVKQGYDVTEPIRDVAGDAIADTAKFVKEDARDMGRFMSPTYYADRFIVPALKGEEARTDTETRLRKDLSDRGRSSATEERTEMLKQKLFEETFGKDTQGKSALARPVEIDLGDGMSVDYANGGRAGYAEGDIVSPEQMLDDEELQKKLIMDALFPEGSPGANEDAIADQMLNMQMQEMMSPRMGRAGGGIMQVAPGVPAGMELDYRNTGGFIPMGGPEKADDVPAMLSKNEFVMTADAVRGMGDGDVNRGAQRMYDLMNNMEAKV
jgi:hypothetical protein